MPLKVLALGTGVVRSIRTADYGAIWIVYLTHSTYLRPAAILNPTETLGGSWHGVCAHDHIGQRRRRRRSMGTMLNDITLGELLLNLLNYAYAFYL